MSRKGKLPIPIPSNVSVSVHDRRCVVQGPKGELSLPLHERVQVTLGEGSVSVKVKNPEERRDRALWGLFRMLIANMVEGVQNGFRRRLELEGVGYRAQVEAKELVLYLGFSHPIRFPIPEGIAISVEKNTITVSGVDKQVVGETAAQIRRLKLPEPYKGKGIRYQGEQVRRKAGKVVKAVGEK